ncbi:MULTISPECIES: hypothetical protein [unclassified Bosea (in: a-proteobacteria)]|uniref:hypothetical protein n=1 Tax=unclassified Bosea (in: a-proteobacteria) TaxID=2653178 RepID=UPI000F75DB97|nr:MULTISPECIES: hypothetical protein [unclassified Bosea (in: a-proteobacteria)]AZO79650.1 hypothetical protein BLM15_20095 [Bosea sp. Tri-49]RXT16105.1 hypothetical protein B5U98_29300 [Bosea sp. Tri-39]RXT39797.1 hypothetical protein B5U99_06345 [Bosea sp. Tri-54]
MNPTAIVATTTRLAADYHVAAATLAAIGTRWGAEWPEAPDAITAPAFVLGGDLERDLLGVSRQPWRKFFGAKHFAREVKRCGRMEGTARRRNLPVEDWSLLREAAQAAMTEAETYELACERVKLAAGIPAAREALDKARTELLAHVAGLMEAEPMDRAELTARAHALNTVAAIPQAQRASADLNGQWLARLAAAVVRLAPMGENS